MSSELLGSIAGIVLSLIFSYVPGLKDKYNAMSGDYKRLIMLGVLLLTAAGVLGVSCAGWFDLVACSQDGLLQLVQIFVIAAISNQSAYALTPKGTAAE